MYVSAKRRGTSLYPIRFFFVCIKICIGNTRGTRFRKLKEHPTYSGFKPTRSSSKENISSSFQPGNEVLNHISFRECFNKCEHLLRFYDIELYNGCGRSNSYIVLMHYSVDGCVVKYRGLFNIHRLLHSKLMKLSIVRIPWTVKLP